MEKEKNPERKIILDGFEKRGGTNPGRPGKRPAPPPGMNPGCQFCKKKIKRK